MTTRLGYALCGIVLSAVIVTIGLSVSWTAVIVFAAFWVALLTIAWNLRKRY